VKGVAGVKGVVGGHVGGFEPLGQAVWQVYLGGSPDGQPASSPRSAQVRRRSASPAISVPENTTSVAPASR
jgi:hypothetical protein